MILSERVAARVSWSGLLAVFTLLAIAVPAWSLGQAEPAAIAETPPQPQAETLQPEPKPDAQAAEPKPESQTPEARLNIVPHPPEQRLNLQPTPYHQTSDAKPAPPGSGKLAKGHLHLPLGFSNDIDLQPRGKIVSVVIEDPSIAGAAVVDDTLLKVEAKKEGQTKLFMIDATDHVKVLRIVVQPQPVTTIVEQRPAAVEEEGTTIITVPEQTHRFLIPPTPAPDRDLPAASPTAQPTAQPTWVETQSPSRGSSTLSTICPSASSTSRREPSLPACSDRTRARPSSSAVRAGTASRSARGRKFSELRRRVPASRACTMKPKTRSALARTAGFCLDGHISVMISRFQVASNKKRIEHILVNQLDNEGVGIGRGLLIINDRQRLNPVVHNLLRVLHLGGVEVQDLGNTG